MVIKESSFEYSPSERHISQVLQAQCVHSNCNGTFTARLHMTIQHLQLLIIAILNANLNAIVGIVAFLFPNELNFTNESHFAKEFGKVFIDRADHALKLQTINSVISI